jgi:hypothetical protein
MDDQEVIHLSMVMSTTYRWSVIRTANQFIIIYYVSFVERKVPSSDFNVHGQYLPKIAWGIQLFNVIATSRHPNEEALLAKGIIAASRACEG